jgi:flagellar FliJ protein
MSDVSALSRVASLAKNEERVAADALARGQQQQQQANTQLQQLENFRQEYEQRLRDMAAAGMPVRQLQEYRKFLSSLNDAIGRQNETIERSERAVCEKRDEYVSRTLRRGSLDRLIVDRKSAHQVRADARDQQRTDDDFARRGGPKD